MLETRRKQKGYKSKQKHSGVTEISEHHAFIHCPPNRLTSTFKITKISRKKNTCYLLGLICIIVTPVTVSP